MSPSLAFYYAAERIYMPLCSVKKNPDDKLNRHICIVFGLPSEFFSRDISTRRFVQQHGRRLCKGLSEAEYFALSGTIFEFFLERLIFKQI